MDGHRKVVVRLTSDQRRELEALTRVGSSPVRRILHARILLMADAEHPLGRYTDAQIGRALGVHVNTVARTRQTFASREGGDAVASIERKRRLTPPTPPKLDGVAEAHLIALCCSPPPAGRRRWTMRLLADAMTERRFVVSVGRETVRKTLKKMRCSPGGSSASAFPSATPPASSRRWKSSSTSTRRPGTTRSR